MRRRKRACDQNGDLDLSPAVAHMVMFDVLTPITGVYDGGRRSTCRTLVPPH